MPKLTFRSIGSRGLQLIEVVIAGAVFFLVSIFLLNLLPMSVWAVSRTETRLNAQEFAYSTLEELRGRPLLELSPGTYLGKTRKVEGAELTSLYRVEDIPGSDPELIKQVTVTVNWNVRSEKKSIVAKAYVSRLKN